MSSPLSATGLSHAYGSSRVLRDVDFSFASGKLVIVVGPNGSGKTTLARILSGVLKPQSGRVLLDGQELATLSHRKIAQSLAVVPQDTSIPFPYSVEEMVAMGRAPFLGALGRESEVDRQTVAGALAELDLVDLYQRDYSTLSGGEKQRVLLARARAQDTDKLLLDEPTAHMDIGHRLHCFEWLRSWLDAAHGLRSAAVITHDLMLAAHFADTLVLLHHGSVVCSGPAETVLTRQRIAEVYGVDARVDRDPEGNLRVTPLGTRPDRAED
ncbi:MAG: ABC transporter ATP-binding protein [bacterium]|nr:ABC transporter ATP-binding protein [bacterium]